MRLFPLSLMVIFLLATGGNGIQEKQNEILRLNWDEVNEILPKYSKFTVVDLETGKKFRVQRRAGSRHADVQPLTAQDTKIMKEIYNGKWSWKRRAIIVHSNKKKIAASMHGMPHGAGALRNNFPGHFCIHFYGSTTHRTNFMDLSHKLMILKASGELESYLNETDAYDLANAYLTGIKQQDSKIVSQTSLQHLNWEEILPKIDNVTINRMAVLPKEDIGDELALFVPVTLLLQLKGIGFYQYDGTLTLVRLSPFDGWKVDSIAFFGKVDLVSEK
ncbi:hypothetical protein [Bacillus sp. B15-48]|uniref:hypothetical protein n=1 Tax=Bacillus sp. B15-48 TaxID=1548601 RepID=UPI001EF3AFC8|nr:hypothetical protein [Bacillus sp. B15-48]MBM4762001.1 hypothetical protein [Bacillus sp. B15-48]